MQNTTRARSQVTPAQTNGDELRVSVTGERDAARFRRVLSHVPTSVVACHGDRRGRGTRGHGQSGPSPTFPRATARGLLPDTWIRRAVGRRFARRAGSVSTFSAHGPRGAPRTPVCSARWRQVRGSELSVRRRVPARPFLTSGVVAWVDCAPRRKEIELGVHFLVVGRVLDLDVVSAEDHPMVFMPRGSYPTLVGSV